MIERFRAAVDGFGGDAMVVGHLHRAERDMIGDPGFEIALPAWI